MIITPTELETQMTEHYLASQLNSINWSSLSQTDKFVALNKANRKINNLDYVFIGNKVNEEQSDSWPRIINKKKVEVPDDVKAAICNIVFNYLSSVQNDRLQMIKSGVSEVKIEGASEKYNLAVLESSASSEHEYLDFLDDWLYTGGGYHGE